MDASFWHERWAQQQIGFHQTDINPYLVRYLDRLSLDPGARVLVPLCGKSLDMLWLHEQGHGVTGVELSEIAARDFFAASGREPCVITEGDFTIWHSGDVEIYCGNFFDLDAGQLEIGGFYDRAALIALPPDMRADYVTHLASIVAKGISGLLVVMEYPEHEMDGPPFSVTEDEVRERFAPFFRVELLDERDGLAASPQFIERGLTVMTEKVYHLRRM